MRVCETPGERVTVSLGVSCIYRGAHAASLVLLRAGRGV